MKRSEFLDEVSEWSDLLDFCRDYDLDICDDIYDKYDADERVEEDVAERECGWFELMEALQSVPVMNGEYFERDGWLSYRCVDDEFESWKSKVLEDCDSWDDFWESEIEEDPDEEFDPFSDEEEEADEQQEQAEEWPCDVAAILGIYESSVRIITS